MALTLVALTLVALTLGTLTLVALTLGTLTLVTLTLVALTLVALTLVALIIYYLVSSISRQISRKRARDISRIRLSEDNIDRLKNGLSHPVVLLPKTLTITARIVAGAVLTSLLSSGLNVNTRATYGKS